ncbi:MAG: hypothetical protein JW965_03920 [Bacteroidales bacterium]|nr:hypothetical protein [Bacteroidales bacterium]
MVHIFKYIFAISIVIVSCQVDKHSEKNAGKDNIPSDFLKPPREYRPGAFWCWLNGNITREAITRDLREMSEKGMGRAEIWDVAAMHNPDNFIPSGPAFLSDSSVALMKHAFSEGEKYGIKIGMVGSSGWNAGGPWVDPSWASKALYFSEIILEGPVNKKIKLPFPEVPENCPKDNNGLPVYYKEVAVLAFPFNKDKSIGGKDEIINLSGQFVDGYLTVSLPEGKWQIMRYLFTNNGQELIVPSPNSKGLFIDFLDPESTKKHLGHFMKRLGIKKGKNTEGGLSYIEFDSMELTEGVPWTDSMPRIFRQMRGYDLTDYLPVLSGWKIKNVTDKFLYDWKKTVSDQLILSHYITGRQFLEKYNLELVAEAGGPGPPIWNTCPVDALKALGNVSVPRGEFWIRHRNMFLIKEVASASHIYGKGKVDAESFTTWRRWKDSPYALKKVVDRAFCEGLNCITFHTFANTNPEDGLPGRTYHAGLDINPGTTWWEKSEPFMEYLSRCSYLLQKGEFVADVCYFYGDQAPNFFPLFQDVPEKPGLKGLSKGYDFDVVNSDVLLNRMSVDNNRIILPDGMSYSLMVLPEQDHMPLDVLKKLERMVMEGATIIGKKPLVVPGLNNNKEETNELSDLAEKMWAELDGEKFRINHYGEGRVVYGLTPTELLKADNIVEDFSYSESPELDYIHRQFTDGDAYFVRNKSDIDFSGVCTFRQSGKFPEIWDPSTGDQLRVNDYKIKNGVITISLELSPGASIFVIFTDEERKIPGILKAEEIIKVELLTGSWRVTFPEGWGAPSELVFDTLISWTDSEIEGVKYFSGTATYHKTLNINKEQYGEDGKVSIDLGNIRDVAEVFINGKRAGVLWKRPFTLDITDLVRNGENQLKIEIVNMWVNRLTGDMLSESNDKRYCRTNHPYVKKDNWAGGGDETFRIQPSGLLGPVRIVYTKE